MNDQKLFKELCKPSLNNNHCIKEQQLCHEHNFELKNNFIYFISSSC